MSYLGEGATADAIAEFFAAAKRLCDVRPAPAEVDGYMLYVSVPARGIDYAVLDVVAAGEQSTVDVSLPGSGWLVLIGNLDPVAEAEIAAHGWPLPLPGRAPRLVVRRDGATSAGAPRQEDVLLATALTRAAASLFERGVEEPLEETFVDRNGIELTLRSIPLGDEWEDWDDETDAPPPPVTRVAPAAGRNDPCPCGSGRKYKKCHLEADESAQRVELPPPRRDSAGAINRRLLRRIINFAEERYGRAWLSEAVNARDELEEIYLREWSAWTAEIGGQRIADEYAKRHRVQLSEVERRWIDLQRAPLRICHVVDVTDFEVELQDVLSGATKTLARAGDAELLDPDTFILARDAEFGGNTILLDVHPYELDEAAAEPIVRDVRERFAESEWNGREAGLLMLRRWTEAVHLK